MELEAAFRAALLRGVPDLTREVHEQVPQHTVGDALDQSLRGGIGLADQRLARIDVAAPRPLLAAGSDGPRHAAQRLQLAAGVVHRGDRTHRRQHLRVQVHVELVVDVVASAGQLHHRRDRLVDLAEVEGRQRWWRLGREGLDAVPVLRELGSDVLEGGVVRVARLERHLDQGGEHERRLVVRVVVERVDEPLPPLLVCELGGQLVEHPHPRRQPRLDAELSEQPARESVQRRDRRHVGVVDGVAASQQRRLVAGCGRLRGPPLEGDPDARFQLGGRRLGEGDRRDRRQRHAPDQHQVRDAVDELGGLAGAGSRLDEQGPVEPVAADGVPRRLVHDGCAAHPGSSTASDARTASCGASTLTSACSPRSRTQTESKSQ